jgi:hypothetical protein
VRVVVEDKHGQPRANWVHAAPDHLFHASVYDQVAAAALPEPPMPEQLVVYDGAIKISPF